MADEISRELVDKFKDCLGRFGNKSVGIQVTFNDIDDITVKHTLIGIPYNIVTTLVGEQLMINPYLSIDKSTPSDFVSKWIHVPIENIIKFKRIELSNYI